MPARNGWWSSVPSTDSCSRGTGRGQWWFELWNTVRKALFTGLTILLVPLGPAMQAWGLCCCSRLHCSLRPSCSLPEDWLSELERNALAVDVATLFLGLALFLNATNNVDAQSEALAVIVSLTIVAINAWFVVRVGLSLKTRSGVRWRREGRSRARVLVLPRLLQWSCCADPDCEESVRAGDGNV